MYTIGSRKSELALVQTHWVHGQLQKHHPSTEFAIQTMETQGDIILDVALAKIGDKGLFTKELELGMIQGQVDLAVHSLKDLPTRLPEGLVLGVITERENPADALVLSQTLVGTPLAALPEGTVVGTSSLRRLAQLRHHFPHLAFKDVRGNLNTRLAKLDAGQYDALILAVAGLERLGMANRISEVISSEYSLHAVGQGALGIECRGDDAELLTLLQVLNHPETAARCLAERALLRDLEGGCQVPIGVNTEVQGDQLTLTGMVASLDGKTLIREQLVGTVTKPEDLGVQLASKLKDQGAGEILAAIFAEINR